MPTWQEYAWAAFLYGALGGDCEYQALMGKHQFLTSLRNAPLNLSYRVALNCCEVANPFNKLIALRVRSRNPLTAACVKEVDLCMNKHSKWLRSLISTATSRL
jgi:hypothetical protein